MSHFDGVSQTKFPDILMRIAVEFYRRWARTYPDLSHGCLFYYSFKEVTQDGCHSICTDVSPTVPLMGQVKLFSCFSPAWLWRGCELGHFKLPFLWYVADLNICVASTATATTWSPTTETVLCKDAVALWETRLLSWRENVWIVTAAKFPSSLSIRQYGLDFHAVWVVILAFLSLWLL